MLAINKYHILINCSTTFLINRSKRSISNTVVFLQYLKEFFLLNHKSFHKQKYSLLRRWNIEVLHHHSFKYEKRSPSASGSHPSVRRLVCATHVLRGLPRIISCVFSTELLLQFAHRNNSCVAGPGSLRVLPPQPRYPLPLPTFLLLHSPRCRM